jgi:asparagine synthase (glutamine-hydrolysing)
MCGIGGILHKNKKEVAEARIRVMTEAMNHRGPDAEGFFIDRELALGHRRLSIIDLSDAANQPFLDNTGRYVIIFNGEIYNYAEIKFRLAGYAFRTHSDTEVILAGYIQWGGACLDYLRGMFTIAIWDKEDRSLFLARDRMGVKPLYFYQDDEQFIFASEIRAILTVKPGKKELDPSAIAEYFRYQSIGFPFSPVKGIHQMEAGSWMRIQDGIVSRERYWDPISNRDVFDLTDKKQVEEKVKALMLQSVQRRLVSDVPVAAFLSGGIDSSAIVGLMVEAGDPSPKTFTISFDEKEFDESEYAEIVAKKFHTDHTRIHLKPELMLEELTHALDAMDIPTGDGINNYVVSKAIHQRGIRVALSGVGGDELFGGYPIFLNYIRLQQKSWIWKMPLFLRQMAGGMMGGGSKKDRMRQMIRSPSPGIENMYPVFRQILSPYVLQELTSLRGGEENGLSAQLLSRKKELSELPLFSQVTAAEYLGYTQNTLLKDTDQMSMAHSLEIREPFFDQELVEFLMSVPDRFKFPVYPKSLLVESLKPLLPESIVFRKKQGFVFPWGSWLRNELRPFCELYIKKMGQRSFIHEKKLWGFWLSFLKGDERIRWMEIWLFVVLEYWMEKNGIE